MRACGREGLTDEAPAARRGFTDLILRGECQRVNVRGTIDALRGDTRRVTSHGEVRMKGTYLRAAN